MDKFGFDVIVSGGVVSHISEYISCLILLPFPPISVNKQLQTTVVKLI